MFFNKQGSVYRLILFGWLIQVIVCHRLWTIEDDSWIFHLPGLHEMHTIRVVLFGLLVTLLGLSIVFLNRKFELALIVSWLIITPFNLNVWQAWFWLYYLLVLTHYLGAAWFNRSIWVFLSGMYWWSGLYKINEFYIEDWAWNLEQLNMTFSNVLMKSLLAVPYIEMLLAGLFWISPTRKYMHLIAAIFHLGIVVIFSPLILDINHVILPWNFMLFILNMVLWRHSESSLKWNWKPILPGLICSWILPAVTLITGLWHAQAFNLYSGRMPYIELNFDGEETSILMLHLQKTGVPCLPDESAQYDTYDKLCRKGLVSAGKMTVRSWNTEEVILLQCPSP